MPFTLLLALTLGASAAMPVRVEVTELTSGSWEVTLSGVSHPQLTDAAGAFAPQATEEDRGRITPVVESVQRATILFLDQQLQGGAPLTRSSLQALRDVDSIRTSGR